jgi:hypothetical protein
LWGISNTVSTNIKRNYNLKHSSAILRRKYKDTNITNSLLDLMFSQWVMTPSTPVSINILEEHNACIFRVIDLYRFYDADEAITFL